MSTEETRDEIEQLIRQSCQAPPPDATFVRALAAHSRRELLLSLQEGARSKVPQLQHVSSTARRLRRAAIAFAGIAALIFISIWLWIGQERNVWAQVVDAVRARPWVHAVANQAGGEAKNGAEKTELWISLTNAVSAIRHGSGAIYDDGRSGVRQEYDPKEQELYRLSAPAGTEKQIRSMQMMFADLFRGSDTLGPEFADTRIATQQRRRVSDQGRKWIEYTLSLEGPAGPQRVVFRVDPQTRLPQSMEYFDANEPAAELKPRMRFVFDYPEDGPSDIYALGVPRSAKIVDRIPKPDLARVIDGVKSSRQRFAGAYYAIVAETIDAPAIGRTDKWWQAANLHQVWCKADSWRVERGSPRKMQDPFFYAPAEPPGADVDKMVWWKEHLKDFDFQPSGVCDGKTIYAPKRVSPASLAASQNAVWETWRTITPGVGRLSNAASFGPASYFMPEYHAYPVTIGAPGRDAVAELDLNPAGELADALLLKYRHNSSNPNAIASWRHWVDPARSYITLRHELGEAVDAKAGSEAKWPDTYVAEELAQAPSGIWYATVVRRLQPGKVASPDKRHSTVYWFFVDFKADIPDALFKPGPLAVKKTTTAPVSSRGTSNLRNIAAAMLRYNDSHGKFPAAHTVDKQGKPLLSWRVELLPLLGQEDLYKQFHLDETWDSEHNRTLIEKMPEVYRTPASGANGPPGAKAREPGQANYLVPVGNETAFPGSNALGVINIRDGCADTIMAVEVGDDHAVLWTKPEDLSFDAANPAEALAALPREGFWAVLCDGSVRWIPKEFDAQYLRAAFTRAGGEAIDW